MGDAHATARTVLPARRGSTMLLGGDRIFYTGPLRRSMKARNLGAISIYAAPEAEFDICIGDGARQSCRIIAVPAYVAHRIVPPRGPIWNLLIEPESVPAEAIEALMALCNGRERDTTLSRLRKAERQLSHDPRAAGFTTAEFDALFLGMTLPQRLLDTRIIEVLRALREEPNDAALSAEACADSVGLSVSRLCHLFRENTGVPFRSCRMWKRARRFLDQATGDASLTDVALGLGYPDSSHFSHSIRRTFGMQPGAIRAGARDLIVWPGAGYTLFAT